MQLDAIDHALLAALQHDARQTNRELAAAAHVSPSTSSQRLQALRRSGVIRGYHADIDPAALGRHVQALTAVTIRPPSRRNHDSFRTWAASLPDVISVFAVAGRDDYLLHLAVADTSALYTFMVDRITERDDVADFHTSVVYEHIRRPTLSPPTPPTEL
jgi:DNA-binding Lrp family transcriptional regulator